MRRKGGRTISSTTESAANTAALPPSAVAAAAALPAESAASAFPAVAIPTLDIFARFQGKRDDFDADWLMLEEDNADKEKAPPISADVAEKLRRHQQLLSSTRSAARKAVVMAANSGGNSDGSLPSGQPGKTTGQGSRKQQGAVLIKGGDDFDRTAAEVALSASATGSENNNADNNNSSNNTGKGGAKRPRRSNPMNDESEDGDDEAYVPEGKDAAQYRMQKKSPPPTTLAGGQPDANAIEASGAEVDREETAEEEGMQGDYLTFLPKNLAATASNPNADASDLQAVVSLGASRTKPLQQQPAQVGKAKGNSNHDTNTNRRGTASDRGLSDATAGGRADTLVVPLWSVDRVRRFGEYYPTNRLVALHQEVCDLVDFLRPTQAEVSLRRYVELQVQRLAKKLWPKSRLIVYGSLYTHLLLPLSDIDMTLVNMPSNVTADEALTALAAEISRAGLCDAPTPQLILKTKVPLIKFQHKGSLVDVDISVNAPDGKNNSDIVVNLLNFYPEARPLIVLVKYFLQQRDMHEPYHGGLGSYATTLLVISFLQSHPIYTTRPQERPFTGLGKLLVDFFRYCGQYWSYTNCGISLTAGGHYFRRGDHDGPFSPASPTSPRSPLGPPQAIIEDPINSNNNVASSLRNFHMISSVFANAYQALTAPFPTAFELNSSHYNANPSGSATARSVADFSPDSPKIALRPTLLSRILHVDADTVYRRQSIATTYAALRAADPAAVDEAEQYKREEDAPMLTGQQTLRLVSTTNIAPSSPITKEEAEGLASLTSAAATASKRRKGNSSNSGSVGAKRPRDTHSSSSSSDSPSDAEGETDVDKRDDGSDSGSNASSVRIDVSKATQRRKQMSRHR